MDAHVESVLKPHFDAALHAELGGDAAETTVDGNKGSRFLLIPYPTALESTALYVAPHVMLEPGCRNATTPVSTFTITPDIAQLEFESALDWPIAEVTVLSGARTFWEKVTLIHAACVNPAKRIAVERTARHWYDLAALAEHEVGAAALEDRVMLGDVIRVKELIFPVPEVCYADCASGKLLLIPEAEHLEALRADYEGMVEARMFWEAPPSFEDLVSSLSELQQEINARCS